MSRKWLDEYCYKTLLEHQKGLKRRKNYENISKAKKWWKYLNRQRTMKISQKAKKTLKISQKAKKTLTISQKAKHRSRARDRILCDHSSGFGFAASLPSLCILLALNQPPTPNVIRQQIASFLSSTNANVESVGGGTPILHAICKWGLPVVGGVK